MEIPWKEDFRNTPLGWDHNNEPIQGSVDMYAYCAALEKYVVEITLQAGKYRDQIQNLKTKRYKRSTVIRRARAMVK